MGLHSNQSVTKSTKEKEIKPKMHFLALTLVATGASALTLTKDLKAASPLVNLGCQCSSLTFVDSQGQVQGNCRSVDSTGARWCYVDHLPSSCQDLSHSARFPANPWSYEACSTPPENSGHHHHVQPAYTAPVHQVPAYTVPVHHAPVHHAPAYTLPVHQPNHIHSAYTGAHQDAGPFAFKNAASGETKTSY